MDHWETERMGSPTRVLIMETAFYEALFYKQTLML